MSDLQTYVARAGDQAALHAPVPTLILELQTVLGELAEQAARATERGRRPFRPTDDWARLLGRLGFAAYLAADQSGVALDEQVAAIASGYLAIPAHAAPDDSWPFAQR